MGNYCFTMATSIIVQRACGDFDHFCVGAINLQNGSRFSLNYYTEMFTVTKQKQKLNVIEDIDPQITQ